MSDHHYKFNVKMHCNGCSNAVDKVLKGIDGITYKISLEKQIIDVHTKTVTYEQVLDKIKKTGKEVTSATKDGAVAATVTGATKDGAKAAV